MNVIFLDVDGVLNTHKDIGKPVDYIDPKKLRLFALTVRAVNAKIVISSSWRNDMANALDDYLAGAEILDRVIGKTDEFKDDKKTFRHHEIQKWLDEHPEVTKYAIIDDVAKAASRSMKKSFFKTDGDIGLTTDMCNKIVGYFNGTVRK